MKSRLADMGTCKRNYRDEDLALFHDMRRRERKNFLIPSAEDSESSPMSTPTRTGRELLAVDSGKNDFDWLLTPPSTPLFPFLDQGGPIVNLSQRRVSTSTSVSKTAQLSCVQEPSPKVGNCTDSSPKLSSTASSAGSNASGGRSLSPFTSRLSPTLRPSSPCRPVTPSRRSSATPSKSNSRSLTPTLQSINTSPSSASRAGRLRGRSRGKSLSPKLESWEAPLPGFSAEPPPNLRTSLSDRTVQRGVTCIPKNKPNTQSSSADMLVASSQLQWHTSSLNGSRNLLSNPIDHSSSQDSKASVISNDNDVAMAEAVLSGCSDGTSKCANMAVPPMEGSGPRRCELPAKRQTKSSGSCGDAIMSLPTAARKSYEQPMKQSQRRSAQAMFRPLLSNAPVTSFCNSRLTGMHPQSSGPLTDSFTVKTRNSCESGNDGVSLEAANIFTGANGNCESVRACHAAIEEENVGNWNKEKEATGRHQGGCGSNVHEERLTCSDVQVDDCAYGCKSSALIDAGNRSLTSIQRNRSPFSDLTGDLLPQCVMQTSQARKAQPEDTDHLMDFEATNLHIPTDCHAKGMHTYQEKIPCSDDQAMSSFLTERPRNSKSKVKENFVEGQKLTVSGKAYTMSLGFGNVQSHHGYQRVLSDLGSFRKQSSVKAFHTCSHDSLPFGETNGSCASFTSDSHSLVMSLPSALGRGQSVELESPEGSVIGSARYGCTAIAEKYNHCIEGVSHTLEIDASENRMPFCAISTGTVDNASESHVISESSNVSALPISQVTSTHPELYSLEMCSMNTSNSEVCYGSSENPQAQATTSDKAAQHDGLSKRTCRPGISVLGIDRVQSGCTEASCSELSRRPFETCTAAGLAGEASHADDPSPTHAQGVALSKRSVTLEEATDTILFCSSVVHELVYKAAALAIETEEQRIPKPSISRRDFVALFGFSGVENKPDNRSRSVKTANGARKCISQPLTDETVHETSSFVQKQRMIHSQTPALTMRQNPMERIGNAVMGNHEEMPTPETSVLPIIKSKQRRRARCRCSCCTM